MCDFSGSPAFCLPELVLMNMKIILLQCRISSFLSSLEQKETSSSPDPVRSCKYNPCLHPDLST